MKRENNQDTEVDRILIYLKKGEKIEDGLKSLIYLCVEGKSHAMDILRKGGLLWLSDFINDLMISNSSSFNQSQRSNFLSLALRVLSAACSYPEFVKAAVDLGRNVDEDIVGSELSSENALIVENSFLQWKNICELTTKIGNGESMDKITDYEAAIEAIMALSIRILKALPLHQEKRPKDSTIVETNADQETHNTSEAHDEDSSDMEPRVTQLEDGDEGSNSSSGQQNKANNHVRKEPIARKRDVKTASTQKSSGSEEEEPELFLRSLPCKRLLFAWKEVLERSVSISARVTSSTQSEELESRIIQIICDALSSFVSDTPDYSGAAQPLDTRNETMEQRKKRVKVATLLRKRAQTHARWVLETRAWEAVIHALDASAQGSRTAASVCFSRLAIALDNDNALKAFVKQFLYGSEDGCDDASPPPVDKCRLRAAVEVALLLSRPELGSWALGLPGGAQQLMLLVSTEDERCQEVAAEVMCYCASTDTASPLLTLAVSSGTLHRLLSAKRSATRAAAASTLTKLALKAKALDEKAPDIAQAVNIALDVVKNANAITSANANNKTKVSPASNLNTLSKSYTSLDSNPPPTTSNSTQHESTTERAVELIAALSSKSFMKEELVHGSFRLVVTCIIRFSCAICKAVVLMLQYIHHSIQWRIRT